MSKIASEVSGVLHDWQYQGRADARTFADLQSAARDFQGPLSTITVERRLLALAAIVGRLLEHSNSPDEAKGVVLNTYFVGVLRALTATADAADVSLE